MSTTLVSCYLAFALMIFAIGKVTSDPKTYCFYSGKRHDFKRLEKPGQKCGHVNWIIMLDMARRIMV